MPTVASKAAVLGAGTVLSIGGVTGATGTETFLPVGELTDIKFDGFKRETAQNTNFDSGQIRQDLGTILDYGSISGTYNRVSTNTGQLAMIAALQSTGGNAYDFKLQLPVNALLAQTTTGDLYTISGIVTEAGAFDLSQTKVSTSNFSIKINSFTFTAGS
ncbi:hypothetical protein [Tunturiibacter psychrotolerans]|uniref:hypothetical protein n=1 Tax=Tunturiibacter psychrotolerans TaxID=3069686 RepID=UPI003D2153B9